MSRSFPAFHLTVTHQVQTPQCSTRGQLAVPPSCLTSFPVSILVILPASLDQVQFLSTHCGLSVTILKSLYLIYPLLSSLDAGGHKAGDQRSEVIDTQSCPTLCNPMDGSPPGFSVHRILQARILEWVAISFSKVINECLFIK